MREEVDVLESGGEEYWHQTLVCRVQFTSYT